MHPQQLRKILVRWTAPMLALAIIGAVVAYLVAGTQKPVYEAVGRLLVLGQVEASALSVTPDQIINTDAALLTQTPLLQQVIKEQNLAESPAELATRITVVPEPLTELIDVKVKDIDRARASRTADGVMNAFIATSTQQSSAASDTARAQVASDLSKLRQQLSDDQVALTAGRRGPDAATLQTAVDSDNAQILQAAERLRVFDTAQQQVPAIQISSPASIPTSPVGASKPTLAALGGFAGLLLGLGLAVLLEYLDQGLLTEEDVRQRLNLPTLGKVPRYWPGVRGGEGSSTTDKWANASAEAYRRLRTNLLFSSVDTPLKSIVVTSARAGEGKTRTVANLAGVMAAAGQRVLIVDADMRRPSQHRLFEIPVGPGMSELLLEASRSQPSELKSGRSTRFPNLSIITAGTIPPNPSELLASKHTASVVRLLERQHDLVVIDTPPSQVVTDALGLAAAASGTVLVIEAGKTNARQAEEAIAALRGVGANVLGIVLNKAKRSRRTSYYYSTYVSRVEEGIPATSVPTNGDAGKDVAWLPLGSRKSEGTEHLASPRSKEG
jgi:polysaccharide biosynthesis transport protein